MNRIGIVLVLTFATVATAISEPLPIHLGQFLLRVERHSLELESARIDREFAETDVAVTRAITRPSIGAQASLSRSLLPIDQTVPGFGTVTIDPANELNLGISLQQLIFDLRSFRALEASRQADSLTGSLYEATRQAIFTGAKKLFYQAILLQEVVEVRRAAEELARESYDDARRRYDAGVASQLDLLRAELSWRATVPETTQADRNLQVVLANIRSFAGIEPDRDIALQGALDVYPPMPQFGTLDETLAGRPDVQALQGAQSLRTLGISAQRAEFYPSLSGSVVYRWSASDEGFSFTDPTQVVTAGLQLQVPIYSGGARTARLRRARLELHGAETELQKKIDAVRTEVRTIELRLDEAASRIEAARSTLRTAELAYEMTELAVDGGISTQLELKDARVSLVSARLASNSAIFDYLSAYFDWQLAVGRGTDPVR